MNPNLSYCPSCGKVISTMGCDCNQQYNEPVFINRACPIDCPGTIEPTPTTEPPTEPGWYWMYTIPRHGRERTWVPAKIDPALGIIWRFGDTQWSELKDAIHPHTKWQGPIKPPDEDGE